MGQSKVTIKKRMYVPQKQLLCSSLWRMCRVNLLFLSYVHICKANVLPFKKERQYNNIFCCTDTKSPTQQKIRSVKLYKLRKIICANLTKFMKNTDYAKIGVFFMKKTIANSEKMGYNHIKVVKSGA